MRVSNLADYWRGWFLGNFEPTVLKTEQFEVGILTHNKGEQWPAHIHQKSTEYNVLLEGKMRVNGRIINKNDVFIIEKNEIAQPIFDEDCRILVIKVPSIPNDKIIVS